MTSIWLRPQGDQEQALQSLVDRVADEHGTVSFPPHLTVCGVPGDLAVLDAAAAYENSPELREFRERLRDITGARPLIPPHISLLYTLDRVSQMPRPDFDAERLEGIAARCAAEIRDTHVTLARPVVNSAGGGETDVRGWKAMRSL